MYNEQYTIYNVQCTINIIFYLPWHVSKYDQTVTKLLHIENIKLEKKI